ncbi:MAG: histidinol-phosphatase [Desulfobacter sp.]|nr:MAG: histidinol-phosphatase [Desulfobacter sp.]
MTIDPTMDCHMHSRYSDGRTSIDRLAASALEKGLAAIAVTDHMPLPYPTRYAMDREEIEAYRNEIRLARDKYSPDLTILAGLEMEYLPEQKDWIKEIADMGWEMPMVSIHGIEKDGKHFMVNGREDEFLETLEHLFDKDIQAFCTRYYTLIQEAAATGWFDIVGHLDVIKKHNKANKYFDETAPWYRPLVLNTLDALAAAGMKMEINTNGLNHPTASFYPSPWIVTEAQKRDIPIRLGSDAHSPEYLGQYFNRI